MISGLDTISHSTISILFGSKSVATPSQQVNPILPLLEATGYTDNVMKAGNAVGKIIEIVASMNSSSAGEQAHMFSMDGAIRIDEENGGYRLEKTGTGITLSEVELHRRGVEMAKRQAEGTGPHAEMARAYIKAHAEGTIVITDLAAYGVKSTLTETVYYYADGRERGGKGTYETTGLREFIAQYTYADSDGMMRDLATGKYASFNQNGTQYSYNVF